MNTAQDVVAYLLASTGGGAQDGEHQAVRQAVVHGVREVMQCRDWLWHLKTESFTTNNHTATVTTTGIISGVSIIGLVGGTATAAKLGVGRMITIPGYFPEPCRVVSWTIVGGTSTSVVVDQVATKSKPNGEAVTATIQTFYDLPEELKDIDALVTNTVGTLHCYITPQEWQRLEINTRGAGEPYYYTIMRSDTNPDCWQIRFVGMPTNGTPVHFTYRYRPREIRYMGYEKASRVGRVAVGNDEITVTLTGAEFPNDIVGSVIRFGTEAEDPDPVAGTAPFVRERYIKAKLTDTTLTVTESLATRTNVRYCITDTIDCSPTMYTAILSAVEMWMARIEGKPAGDAITIYNRDLRIAMENDVVSPRSGRPIGSPYPTPRSRGWHSEMMPDLE